MTNRNIAQRRGISLDAVKYHVANAIGKLGLSNKKALRQWFCAPKGSALNRLEKTVDGSIRLGPIGQMSRTVKDIKQAEAWYGEVLGLPHLYTFGRLAFFDCGGTRLFLTQEVDVPKEESILYLRVTDIEKAHNALKARGVEFTSAPHMIHRHADGTEDSRMRKRSAD